MLRFIKRYICAAPNGHVLVAAVFASHAVRHKSPFLVISVLTEKVFRGKAIGIRDTGNERHDIAVRDLTSVSPVAAVFVDTLHDLTVLFDRNAGNSTMQKLITDYAKQNNRDIQRHYRPTNADVIESVKNIPEVIRVVIKWHNKPDIFNQFVGEGSKLDSFLRDE